MENGIEIGMKAHTSKTTNKELEWWLNGFRLPDSLIYRSSLLDFFGNDDFVRLFFLTKQTKGGIVYKGRSFPFSSAPDNAWRFVFKY